MASPTAGTATVQGAFSAPQTFTFQSLPAPASMSATYMLATSTLDITWAAVDGATGYAAEVLDPQSIIVGSQTSTTSPITMTALTLTPGTTYTVNVYGTAAGVDGAPATATLQVVALTAPTIQSVTCQADGVAVAFSTVTGANTYLAQILDTNSAVIASQVGTDSPILVPITTLTTGMQYTMQVSAEFVSPQ